MLTTAYIGPSISITGEVTSEEPLTVAGHVEGAVTVNGHALTIAVGGSIEGETTADAIHVSGSVQGQLKAASRILVDSGARVEGDLSAPLVSVADGANIDGQIDAHGRSRS